MTRQAWPIPALWPGETAVVVATGPSLSLAQIRTIALARLDGRCRVFAVNDAVWPCWFADWLHACDAKWWHWHIQRVQYFQGVKTSTDLDVPDAWAHYLKRATIEPRTGWCGGFPDDPGTVATGGNSGYQAIQCAAKAGCTRVLLIGFDMKPEQVADTGKALDDFRTHYFGDHPDGIRSDYIGTMLPYFETLVAPLAERGVEVINATETSAIECFPRGDLAALLDNL